MSSPEYEDDNEIPTTLPPVITNNPREKLDAEHVTISDIKVYKDKCKPVEIQRNTIIDTSASPKPKHPLEITWSPDIICLKLEDDVTIVKLRAARNRDRIKKYPPHWSMVGNPDYAIDGSGLNFDMDEHLCDVHRYDIPSPDSDLYFREKLENNFNNIKTTRQLK